jgi:hypothetical protein
MLDAVGRLVNDGPVCCSFSNLIVGKHRSDTNGQTDGDDNVDEDGLNRNQVRAVESSENPLALIWGPPGNVETPLCKIFTDPQLSFRHWENDGGRENSAKAAQNSG